MNSRQARLTTRMDAQAFKNLILPSKHRLYRLALSLLKDGDEANDILQEAMLKLWANRQKVAECQNAQAFAMRIIRNLCLDRLKSKSYLNRAGQSEIPDFMNREASPYQKMELMDSQQLMQRLFLGLPEQQQTIIRLRDVEEMSYEEIEEATGLSINTIRVNLSRARKAVREKFIEINNYELE